ncbi:MAG: hypothetical protein JOZ87_34395 [Chloroflexi bacterium]|nr:hypothetical protein [Chloroflexota bacterium]
MLHGAVGGWDEVAIAVAAFVVLWVAVKLAGRKPANEDADPDDEVTSDALPAESTVEEQKDPAHTASNRV